MTPDLSRHRPGLALPACRSLQSDTERGLTHSARLIPPPPIPNTALQARWRAALKGLHDDAGTCISFIHDHQTTGHMPPIAQMLSSGQKLTKAYAAHSKVTSAGEKAATP